MYNSLIILIDQWFLQELFQVFPKDSHITFFDDYFKKTFIAFLMYFSFRNVKLIYHVIRSEDSSGCRGPPSSPPS